MIWSHKFSLSAFVLTIAAALLAGRSIGSEPQPSKVDAVHLAVGEINGCGGVRDRASAAIVENDAWNGPRAPDRRCLKDWIGPAFGGRTSAGQRADLPIVEKHDVAWMACYWKVRQYIQIRFRDPITTHSDTHSFLLVVGGLDYA